MTILLAGERSDALRLEFGGSQVVDLLQVGAIPGVAILFAGGENGPGTGKLRSTGDGTLLQWRAPGSATFGAAVSVGSDGDYVLEDGDDPDSFLRVRVFTSFLVGPGEADVVTRDTYNELGPDDVTAAEASAGAVETRVFGLFNRHAHNDAQDVRVWIDPATALPPATGGIEISDDGATWVTPTSPTHIDALTFASIAPGASVSIHMRRTINASTPFDPSVLNVLKWDWLGH